MAENEPLSSAAQETAETPEVAEEIEVTEGEDAAPVESGAGPRLVLKRSGAETEHVFPLGASSVVGRFDPDVGPIDVDLGGLDEGKYVSRKHARIWQDGGSWRVQDLGSSNGTYVLRGDFERIEESEITDGDELAFGNARFVFRVA